MGFMTKKNNKTEMLTVAQVAQMLGISYAAALRRVEAMPGVLELGVPGKKQRKRMLRVSRHAVEAYIRECRKVQEEVSE
jgi:hypothetical protein